MASSLLDDRCGQGTDPSREERMLDTFLSLPHWPKATTVRYEACSNLVRRRVAVRLLGLLCMELVDPILDLLTGFRFCHAVALLDLACQHLDIAFDLLYIVVSEFAPLANYASTQLL